MSLSFCVLGSGSSGNCTVVALNGSEMQQYILIDAGLSPRMTAARLAPLGITLNDISHILLTHLDRDHYYPSWNKAAQRHDIMLHTHRRQRSRAMSLEMDFKRLEMFNTELSLGETTYVQSVPLAHDDLGTVGFVLEHDGHRLGFATDLGHVTEFLLECFVDLHGLAIESNYDRQMQLASARPMYLKRRIMGGSGHLSNEQSLEAVLAIAEQSCLSQIALLHLSRQCNCPKLLTRLYVSRARHLLNELTVTNQYTATPMLQVSRKVGGVPRQPRPHPAEQLSLF